MPEIIFSLSNEAKMTILVEYCEHFYFLPQKFQISRVISEISIADLCRYIKVCIYIADDVDSFLFENYLKKEIFKSGMIESLMNLLDSGKNLLDSGKNLDYISNSIHQNLYFICADLLRQENK